jgi:hypothetical protein
MSKEVEIKFRWTKELAIEASKKYYDYDMRHSNKRYVGWFFVALIQFAIVGAFKHDVYGLLYLATFLVAYWYYGRWYLRKKMLEKFYDKQNIDATQAHFTLKEDGLHSGDNLISWNQIDRVIKFEEGALLQIKGNTLFFKRDAFESFEDLQTFYEMMKNEGKL